VTVKTKILVVEDEVIVAEDLRQGLENLGYAVTGMVGTGAAALESIAREQPDLVLMDIQLNGAMDGIRTAGEIRTLAHVPVVYLTAHSDPRTLARAAETEPFGFLLKPFEERDLYSTIEIAIYKHRAETRILESEERYRRLTQALTDYMYTVRVEDGVPVETVHSPACIAVTGYTQEEFKRDPYLWLTMVEEPDRARVLDQASQVLIGGAVSPLEHRIIRKDGTRRWVRNTPVPRMNGSGKVASYDGLVQDITVRKVSEEEREKLVRELQDALASVKTLSGMLPICASCKKIRDDAGYWTQVEAYLMKHTDAHFSHGLCPDCAETLYPEIFGKKDG
jgi:PAS domain S-box-containing protein